MAVSPDIWVIVPAAGIGARMQAGLPKQYLPLLGRPVILHTLERLCSYAPVRGVFVGVAPDDIHWRRLPTDTPSKLLGTFVGGAVRAKTVLNGLAALADRARADDWVMVHDAVRPCVRHTDLDRLVAACAVSPDGALLAAPVTDTVKRTDASGVVLETVARAGLWRALTPQMFRLNRLREALASAEADGVDVTDESAAIERRGGRPRVVEGASDNLKITRPTDLAAAELFLKQQVAEQS